MRTRQWMWAGLAAASAFWPAFAGAAEIGSYSAVRVPQAARLRPSEGAISEVGAAYVAS